jgi:hypothetical protein
VSSEPTIIYGHAYARIVIQAYTLNADMEVNFPSVSMQCLACKFSMEKMQDAHARSCAGTALHDARPVCINGCTPGFLFAKDGFCCAGAAKCRAVVTTASCGFLAALANRR